MGFAYLAALLLSLAAMVALDRRFRLVFWHRPVLAAAVLVLGLGFFLGWDLLCIRFDVFGRGASPALTGIVLLPELTLEEPVFLLFLGYLTLVLLRGARQLDDRMLGDRMRGAGTRGARQDGER